MNITEWKIVKATALWLLKWIVKHWPEHQDHVPLVNELCGSLNELAHWPAEAEAELERVKTELRQRNEDNKNLMKSVRYWCDRSVLYERAIRDAAVTLGMRDPEKYEDLWKCRERILEILNSYTKENE